MRIAVVHSFYRSDSPSGENTVVVAQADALRERGHDVVLVGRSSDEIAGGPRSLVTTAWNVATGGGDDPTDELRRFRPDITHVHNLFPNFGTDWLSRWAGPLVATVHNYRSICANAVLFRDDHTCTLCPDGHRWAGVRHGCYRDSAIASAPIAWRNRRGLPRDPLFARADRIVVLSQRASEILTGAGARADRMRLIPNGVAVPPPAAGQRHDRWATVGRLSAEKGLPQLLRWWPSGRALDVIGSGPLAAQLEAAAPPGVRFLGAVPRDRLLAELPRYRGLVFPGVAPEGAYPLAVVEAWAAGLPVLARAGGAGAHMVERWGGGGVYSDPAQLAALLDSPLATADPRANYEREFTVDRWIARLERVFREAGAGRRAPGSPAPELGTAPGSTTPVD